MLGTTSSVLEETMIKKATTLICELYINEISLDPYFVYLVLYESDTILTHLSLNGVFWGDQICCFSPQFLCCCCCFTTTKRYFYLVTFSIICSIYVEMLTSYLTRIARRSGLWRIPVQPASSLESSLTINACEDILL